MSKAPRRRLAVAAAPARSPVSAGAILAFASAVVVTIEFIVVGLLPAMARDLGLSLADAGRFVTWFALSSAILGPPLTIVASRMQPHRVVVAVLLVSGFASFVATLVPSYGIIAAARVVQGAALPVLVSIGSAAVADLAGPGREGRAIAVVNMGVVVGIVLAMPAGVVLADRSGWSTSFVVLAVLAVVAAVLVGGAFPRIRSARPASVKAQATILGQAAFQSHLLLSALLFTAMFTAYTYLAAFLETVAGFTGPYVALALTGFGVAGLLGNWVAGRAVDRGPTAATAGAAAALALATAAVSLFGDRPMLLPPLLGIWGAAHAAAFVLCQVRVMLAGAGAPAFAASLNISACNLGIAFGAVAGGWIVERSGIGAVGFGSAILASAALALAILIGPRPASGHRLGACAE